MYGSENGSKLFSFMLSCPGPGPGPDQRLMERQYKPEDCFSCGSHHTAAVTQEGQVVCWGLNSHGQCIVPADLGNVVAVSCGSEHTAALTQEGRVVCWGRNTHGQCRVPTDLEDIVAISCGGFVTAALASTGTIILWGYCYREPLMSHAVAISAGYEHCGVITVEGKVVCWGSTGYHSFVPENVENVISLCCGGMHTVALTGTGVVLCWGSNVLGQCSVPEGLENIVAIGTGCSHTTALTRDSKIIVWGSGTGNNRIAATPVLENVISIRCGRNHAAALTQDGTNLLGKQPRRPVHTARTSYSEDEPSYSDVMF
jgi:alpha-tubulin suppressor-like RCC1 family protein